VPEALPAIEVGVDLTPGAEDRTVAVVVQYVTMTLEGVAHALQYFMVVVYPVGIPVGLAVQPSLHVRVIVTVLVVRPVEQTSTMLVT
jgi:hypothetical protein